MDGNHGNESDLTSLEETAIFIIHAIRQFCFGFEKMNNLEEHYVDGSPGKAFFINAIYQQLAVFYLIDKRHSPIGGVFYPALKKHGLEKLLDPIRRLMETPLGNTTFGEIIRVFRNKVIVHPDFGDSDLDRIYKQVDISMPDIQAQWQDLLLHTYTETKLLAIRIARATGRPLSDFGIHEIG
jgi:hypothetical protein